MDKAFGSCRASLDRYVLPTGEDSCPRNGKSKFNTCIPELADLGSSGSMISTGWVRNRQKADSYMRCQYGAFQEGLLRYMLHSICKSSQRAVVV
jgi:hypothetical protein